MKIFDSKNSHFQKLKNQIQNIWKTLKIIWQLDKATIFTRSFHAFVTSTIPFIEIYLSAYVLDQLANGLSLKPFILRVLLILVSIFLLKVLVSYLQKIMDVRSDLCYKRFNMLMGERTLTMDYELLDSPYTNALHTKIRNDNNWGAGIMSVIWQFPSMIACFIQLVYSVIILVPLFVDTLVFKDPLALFTLLLFFAVILFYIYFSAKTRKTENTLLDETANDFGYRGYYIWNRQEYRNGIDIRVFKGQKLIEDSILKEQKKDLEYTKKFTTNSCISGLISGLSPSLLQVIAYLFVAIRATAGALTVGSVVKYASVIYRFSSALSDFFQNFSYLAISAGRMQSTLEFINIQDVLPKGSIPVEKRAFCEQSDNDYEIELQNVSFKYPGSDNWSLRNVSLKFHVGQRLAIVGMNGSGKTTLIKLLCRLYDPTEGSILLNGVDIRKYNYSEYISLFSVVFQDFKLFAFNLGQNIAASAEYDREKVMECLNKAGLKERFSSLPSTTETYLYKGFDEKGVEISGGEAQKIALARALYKDAPFIILDEPTAALDPIAEYDIYKRFDELIQNKTAVYISHRLSSCRFCDDIAVFHEGQMIQRGNHDTLIKDVENKYYEMWNAQAQYYE